MVIDDNFYMSLAINEAWGNQLLTFPNPAVGSVVVKSGEILSIEAHKKAGLPHAEVLALKYAYLKQNPQSLLAQITDSKEIHRFLIENHNGFFNDCEIYITLEPCNHIGKTPACSDLLSTIKPKRVIFSVFDPNNDASGGYEKLINANIEVTTGVLEDKGMDLLFPFLSFTQKKSFVFFKLASRVNGSIDGGYITSKESLEYVHKIRTVIDLLVIGGNTVRIDRPTLDCRFIDTEKSPNILIYSQSKNFDTTIPLFNVKNRKVSINDKIDFNNKFAMIEGGYNLLNNLINQVDMLVLFVSPNFKNSNDILLKDIKFRILYSKQIGDDQLMFLKKKI
ncbi:MAG: bifunctional diaminohydroxyphosphoribosylaminopyrimidine deaminase/5-amino-6-(5-phosphoribosylamino)uracil reductase RibD [Arcobacteraceae bacterium]|jgi:diaminohydroxyphosphoribosylaminopyrimidine deaminase/5-amino-6-(5-phosphoribosylamino)uracil reductase|nr:bifunctional diaminohydroxyphosphoribosylaminopyrimidine deaminase/5-amino-6-(5-phosphoribosylamino)uracil reductase RibD [Arcobacteraceae bacterium]MDY0326977.1 bifunctional diaminohydroxyphosphoribosylaminopyrimidine deaminase/5-amino-6-(5-phosphoribosylamino)uracil reductase RibD [Arcobacteraceae bacterium]